MTPKQKQNINDIIMVLIEGLAPFWVILLFMGMFAFAGLSMKHHEQPWEKEIQIQQARIDSISHIEDSLVIRR